MSQRPGKPLLGNDLDPAAGPRALLPVLLFIGTVVAVISSLGAPLIPSIATAYDVSIDGAQWSLTIALLAGAVTVPILGRLGDGPYRRQVMITVLGLVAVGSLLAALPLSYGWLLIGRALQGIGLGLTPLAMTVAQDHLPAERSRNAVAILAVAASAGMGLGYPLTGLLADLGGLHAPFWFGALISALALAVAAVVLPTSRHLDRRPLDFLGAVLLSVGLIGLLLCLSEGGIWGWTSARLLIVAVGATAVLGLWVWYELRAPVPLVDLRLMRGRVVLTVSITGPLVALGMYILLPLVSRYVQTPSSAGYGLGSTLVMAGLVLLPFSITSVASSRLIPLLRRTLGPRTVLPIGSLLVATAMTIFAFARSELWDAFLVMGVAGLGVGLTFAAIPLLIVRSVPHQETGSALGVNQVLRQIGLSIGSALGAAVLTQHTVPPATLPASSGFTVAALVGACLCVLGAIVSAVLLPATTPDRTAVPPSTDAGLTEYSVDGLISTVTPLPHSGTPRNAENAPTPRVHGA